MGFVFTIAAFVLVLTFLVLVHELGHYWTARALGIRVMELGIGFPPRIRAFRRNGIEYSINAIPVGGFVRLDGESDPRVPDGYAGKPVWVRAAVLVAGSGMNLLLAWIIFGGIASLPYERLSESDIVIQQVVVGSPAEQAGLQEGDIIEAVNGVNVVTLRELSTKISRSMDGVALRIRRGAIPIAAYLTPRANPPPGEGPMGVSVQLTNPVFENQRLPIWQAPLNGLLLMGNVIGQSASELGRWIGGDSGIGIAGPVGIAQGTGEAARSGVLPLMAIVGLLSLNLGILNLLPIPALDGGRLPFLLLELLRRGKRLPPERENLIHLVGFVFLLSVILIVTVGVDLPRLLRGDSILP